MTINKINFGAGPAALPTEVLHEASKSVWMYKNSGYSVLELPHRGELFEEILDESKQLVHELCNIGDDYEVLWLHGGGRMQFCMVPMNLLTKEKEAGYIDSGHWAAEAIEYAQYYGKVNVLGSTKHTKYNCLPELKVIPENLAYVHITTNNTIYGTQYKSVPETKVPLIADMSSDIFSETRDYSKYDLFYAAAQKNLGTPGVGLVVIKKSLLAKCSNELPPMLSYKAHVKEKSNLNTSNVSGVYISLLMLRWIKEKGIKNIEAENRYKAALLYDAIDSSSIFLPHVSTKNDRSNMNVCFTTSNVVTQNAFINFCASKGIMGIEGHRSTGGFRISLYNAISLASVETLVKLMREFETKV